MSFVIILVSNSIMMVSMMCNVQSIDLSLMSMNQIMVGITIMR